MGKHFIIILIVSLYFAGCSNYSEVQPSTHIIMSKNLQTLMAQMNTLLFDQIRTDVELDKDRYRNAKKVAEAAGELQKTIKLILEVQPSLKLGAKDDITFSTLADILRTQSGQLETLARQNKFNELPQAFSAVKNSCTSCHSLFRKK